MTLFLVGFYPLTALFGFVNVKVYVINITVIVCSYAKNAVSLQYATRTKL